MESTEARLPKISVLHAAKVHDLQSASQQTPEALVDGAMGGAGEGADVEARGEARAGKGRDSAKDGARGAQCKDEFGEGVWYK